MDTAACCYPETDWQGEQIVYKELQRSAEEHKSIRSFVHSMPGGLSRLKKKKKKKGCGLCRFCLFPGYKQQS